MIDQELINAVEDEVNRAVRKAHDIYGIWIDVSGIKYDLRGRVAGYAIS